MIVLLKKYSDVIIFLFLTLIIFSFWKLGHNFFWRDEWDFLSDFRNFSFSYFFKSFNGHIKPVFKIFYWMEVTFFGLNANLYSYANLIVFACAIFFVFKLIHYSFFVFKGRTRKSWIQVVAPVLIAATHPINFNHLLWSFQVSQSLFLLFQICSLYYFMRFLHEKNSSYLLLTFFFIILQNYSFGNGIFYSLCFVSFSIFFVKEPLTRIKLSVSFISLFLGFLIVQSLFGLEKDQLSGFFHNIGSIIKAFIFMIDLNIVRTFFIADFPAYQFKIFGLLVLITILLVGIRNKRSDKSLLWLYFSWFIANSVSIPITRPNIIDLQTVPHYYTVMSIIPLLLLTSESFTDLHQFFSLRIKLSGLIILLLVFFLIDNRMVSVFNIRNLRNELALLKAVENNTTYVAFDDPYFTHSVTRIKDPKEIYLYWKKRMLYSIAPQLNNEPKK